MIPLELDEIEALCPGSLERASRVTVATGVQIDSRRVTPGDLFVAVGDGEAFAGDAMARRAAGALVPDDAFTALAALGRGGARPKRGDCGRDHRLHGEDVDEGHSRRHSQAPAKTVAAEANDNNELGVPLTLCGRAGA